MNAINILILNIPWYFILNMEYDIIKILAVYSYIWDSLYVAKFAVFPRKLKSDCRLCLTYQLRSLQVLR